MIHAYVHNDDEEHLLIGVLGLEELNIEMHLSSGSPGNPVVTVTDKVSPSSPCPMRIIFKPDLDSSPSKIIKIETQAEAVNMIRASRKQKHPLNVERRKAAILGTPKWIVCVMSSKCVKHGRRWQRRW